MRIVWFIMIFFPSFFWASEKDFDLEGLRESVLQKVSQTGKKYFNFLEGSLLKQDELVRKVLRERFAEVQLPQENGLEDKSLREHFTELQCARYFIELSMTEDNLISLMKGYRVCVDDSWALSVYNEEIFDLLYAKGDEFYTDIVGIISAGEGCIPLLRETAKGIVEKLMDIKESDPDLEQEQSTKIPKGYNKIFQMSYVKRMELTSRISRLHGQKIDVLRNYGRALIDLLKTTKEPSQDARRTQ